MPAGLQPGYRFTPLLIQLGDIVFGQVDTDGVHWHCSTLSGWDGTEVKTTITPRQSAHGSDMSTVYLAERVITLAGKIIAPNAATLDRALDRLLAAAALGDTLLTVGESTPKQAVVRRSGKPLAERLTGTVVDWSLLLTASDPRRYDTTLHTATTPLPSSSGGLVLPAAPPWDLTGAVTVGGFIQADNTPVADGGIDSPPLLTITGPVQQPVVTARYADGTTAALNYAGDVAGGDTLTIDCATRQVTIGGSSRRRYLSGDWLTVPPGGVSLLFGALTYNATTTLTASWRPAWI